MTNLADELERIAPWLDEIGQDGRAITIRRAAEALRWAEKRKELHKAIREDRDEYEALVERIVPEAVRTRDGTKQEAERWIKSRINLDYERVGRACMDAVIEGSMIRAECECAGPHVFIWNGNAPEQIGEHVQRANIMPEPPQ